MALNDQKAWLVCYDITDRRRLSRFHSFIKKRAVPVQYSVFCFEGSAAQVGKLAAEITSLIDTAADDVRIYQMPERPLCDALGAASVPSGVTLHSARNQGWPGLIGGRAS